MKLTEKIGTANQLRDTRTLKPRPMTKPHIGVQRQPSGASKIGAPAQQPSHEHKQRSSPTFERSTEGQPLGALGVVQIVTFLASLVLLYAMFGPL
jgi:hypothetical protein